MVQTPQYWEKERFQPLTEVKTMYGNKVQIPKSFEDTWKKYYEGATKINKKFPQATLNGYMKSYGKSFRSLIGTHLLQVYAEEFKEDEYSQQILSAEY